MVRGSQGSNLGEDGSHGGEGEGRREDNVLMEIKEVGEGGGEIIGLVEGDKGIARAGLKDNNLRGGGEYGEEDLRDNCFSELLEELLVRGSVREGFIEDFKAPDVLEEVVGGEVFD